MIVKLSEKQINEAIDYLCEILERCRKIKGTWDLDKQYEKLHKALNVILDMKDELQDNNLVRR